MIVILEVFIERMVHDKIITLRGFRAYIILLYYN